MHLGSEEKSSDRNGENSWTQVHVEIELIGLAGGLGQRVKERQEMRVAPRFLVEPSGCWLSLVEWELGDKLVEDAQGFLTECPIRVHTETSSGKSFP